jgi:tRNA nucleotidyltransferase (CCA-adding enzyme)
MTNVRLFRVGGAVRDEILGVESTDEDFAVEAESFEAMLDWLNAEGFRVFLESPEHGTVRARFPKGDPRGFGGRTADFVLCRREGPYSDGRHPDWVKVGTIWNDLARRDFTMNAIAQDVETGEILDPHGGRVDLRRNVLRCVGSAEDRFRQDALRAVRALRFALTKRMCFDGEIGSALWSSWLPPLLDSVPADRRRHELTKMFKFNTLDSMSLIMETSPAFQEALFKDGLWLMPTQRDK